MNDRQNNRIPVISRLEINLIPSYICNESNSVATFFSIKFLMREIVNRLSSYYKCSNYISLSNLSVKHSPAHATSVKFMMLYRCHLTHHLRIFICFFILLGYAVRMYSLGRSFSLFFLDERLHSTYGRNIGTIKSFCFRAAFPYFFKVGQTVFTVYLWSSLYF